MINMFLNSNWITIIGVALVVCVMCTIVYLIIKEYRFYTIAKQFFVLVPYIIRLNELDTRINTIKKELYPIRIKVREFPYTDTSKLSLEEKKEYRRLSSDLSVVEAERNRMLCFYNIKVNSVIGGSYNKKRCYICNKNYSRWLG